MSEIEVGTGLTPYPVVKVRRWRCPYHGVIDMILQIDEWKACLTCIAEALTAAGVPQVDVIEGEG